MAKDELGDIYGHYRSTFNYCDVINQQSYPMRWKKTRSKGYYAVQGHSRLFKVIEVGINRKPLRDFLLVIRGPNINWHPISYRFEVIAA